MDWRAVDFNQCLRKNFTISFYHSWISAEKLKRRVFAQPCALVFLLKYKPYLFSLPRSVITKRVPSWSIICDETISRKLDLTLKRGCPSFWEISSGVKGWSRRYRSDRALAVTVPSGLILLIVFPPLLRRFVNARKYLFQGFQLSKRAYDRSVFAYIN
jgi:hypothetical protein